MRQLLSKMFHRQLLKLKYVHELFAFKQQYEQNCSSYPGHFYNPIFDKQELLKRREVIWPSILPDSIPDIHLNLSMQIEWVTILSSYYSELPFTEEPNKINRYYYNNEYYSYTDAITLYGFLRKLMPSQVIEIGSGYSSAVMLDSADQLKLTTKFTFIDPFPQRLHQLLKQQDNSRAEIMPTRLQQIPLHFFEELKKNDILFIDSSHVIKTDSDVNYYLFEILPRLKEGVYIHIHDIFYPFEYPKEWIEAGFNWSELFAVRAFLMNNKEYQIQFFSHFLHCMHPESFEKMPLMRRNYGGNLWLKKGGLEVS